MKKYIKPATKVVNVDCESLLNTMSLGNDTITPENHGGFTPRSKKNDIWEYDEEEDW